ncbi:hypothetical protein [Pseudomonas oryzihabitans]|uniref:hypothetical protein n=1 Tax=Pseudomonas oryzihabitans TaxID=47885 RepID=UPI00289EA853|nr:hypothetical protein [Pseudomonas oryzihabitans]
MTQDIEYRIAKLSPKAGDVIVIKVDSALNAEQLIKVLELWAPAFRDLGCKVVVVDRLVELQLVESVQSES